MILQKDKRYTIEPLKRYGCYFHCIAFLANKYVNCDLSVEIMEEKYKLAVNLGYMDVDCYIKRPDAIFRLFGFPVAYLGKQPSSYLPGPNEEIEILCFKRTYQSGGKPVTYKHFVVGDGRGHVAYDPQGNSNAVKYGNLVSKRVFKVLV